MVYHLTGFAAEIGSRHTLPLIPIPAGATKAREEERRQIMEDFGTSYAIILNHPEPRRSLISEAERTRRSGRGATISRDLARLARSDASPAGFQPRTDNAREPVATQLGSPPSIVAAALARKTRTITHLGGSQ